MTIDTFGAKSEFSNLAPGARFPEGRPIAFLFAQTLAALEFATVSNIKTLANWTTKKTAIKSVRCFVLPIEDSEVMTDSETIKFAKTMASGSIDVMDKGETIAIKCYNVAPEEIRRFQPLKGQTVYGYFLYASNCIVANSPDDVKYQPLKYQLSLSKKKQSATEPGRIALEVTTLEPQINDQQGIVVNFNGTDITAEELSFPIMPLYFELVSQEVGEIVVKSIDSEGNDVAGLATADFLVKNKATQAVISITAASVSGTNTYTLTGTIPVEIYTVETKGVTSQTLKTHESEKPLEVSVTA